MLLPDGCGHGYANSYVYAYADRYSDGDEDGYPNTDCHGHGYPDTDGDEHAVMALASRKPDNSPEEDTDTPGNVLPAGRGDTGFLNASAPPGARFAQLGGQPLPQPARATGAPNMGSGGTLSNDGAMEAILTQPIHQARVQAEMSKQRLKKMASQIKQAQHVF